MKARKITALIMSLSMAASMTACVNTTQLAENSVPDKPASVSEDTAAVREQFVKEMAAKGITESMLNTLENRGLTEEEIGRLTIEEIDAMIDESKSETAAQQEKTALANKILSGELDVHDSPDYVRSGNNGSTNLGHVEQLLASLDKGETYSFMGLMGGGTIPVVYEAESYPDGGVAITTYIKEYPSLEGSPVNRYAVTDIYITDSFYQFTDNNGLFLSIPRHSLAQTPVENNHEGTGTIEGAKVTSEQACDIATEMIGLLYGAIGHAEENGDINIMNSYGVIIPQGTVPDPSVAQQITPHSEGTVMVAGEQYYIIGYYHADGEQAGEMWLVSTADPNHAFLVSMVDGSLIPVAYNGYKHIELK